MIVFTIVILPAGPAAAHTATDDLWKGKGAVKEQPTDDRKIAPPKDQKGIVIFEEMETI